MSDNAFLFIQRRHDVTPDDNTMFLVQYRGVVDGSIDTLIEEGSTSFLSGHQADPGRLNATILAYEAMLMIKGVVPRYCQPDTRFVTLVHDYGEGHREHDRIKASTLPELLGCKRDQIVVVLCDVRLNGAAIHVRTYAFEEYFSDAAA